MDYGKNKKAICLILCFILSLSSCCSNKSRAINSTDTEGIAQSIGRMESTAESLDRAITDCSNSIEQCIIRSREIKDTAARIEYLLTEYDRTVNELLYTIREQRAIIEDTKKELYNFDWGYNTSYSSANYFNNSGKEGDN